MEKKKLEEQLPSYTGKTGNNKRWIVRWDKTEKKNKTKTKSCKGFNKKTRRGIEVVQEHPSQILPMAQGGQSQKLSTKWKPKQRAENKLNDELQSWLAWARGKADWYDPFTETPDEHTGYQPGNTWNRSKNVFIWLAIGQEPISLLGCYSLKRPPQIVQCSQCPNRSISVLKEEMSPATPWREKALSNTLFKVFCMVYPIRSSANGVESLLYSGSYFVILSRLKAINRLITT